MGAKESRIGFLSYDEAVKRGKPKSNWLNPASLANCLILGYERLRLNRQLISVCLIGFA